jgi:hypothetical protein
MGKFMINPIHDSMKITEQIFRGNYRYLWKIQILEMQVSLYIITS